MATCAPKSLSLASSIIAFDEPTTAATMRPTMDVARRGKCRHIPERWPPRISQMFPSPSRNRGTAREKVRYIEPYAGCSCGRDSVAATEYPKNRVPKRLTRKLEWMKGGKMKEIFRSTRKCRTFEAFLQCRLRPPSQVEALAGSTAQRA